jgi:hypothetical protein
MLPRAARTPLSCNTPIEDRLVSQVTITDPHHSLAGQRFPVISLCAPQGPHKLVIALPDGRQRAGQRSATDLDAAAPVPAAAIVDGPRLGARSLLSLARFLRNMLASQEIPDVPAHTSASSAPTSSLAADVTRSTVTTGTALGAVTPTDAAPCREGEAAC